jgi:ADP-heptose:LPS heptosyltransferase
MSPARVLILKPCCIGDVLLASPLAAAVRAAWPGAVLNWAADRHSHDVAACVPGVDAVIEAEGCVPGAYSLGGLFRLTVLVKAGAYDVVLVPDRSAVLGAVPWLARVPLRAGLDSGGRGRFYTHRVPVDESVHEAALYAAVGRAAGLSPDSTSLRFEPLTTDREMADWLFPRTARRVAMHPGGGINPGMALLEKRWPPERYAEICADLAKAGAQVVLLGDDGDRDAVDTVIQALPIDLREAIDRGAERAAADAPIVDLCGSLDLGLTGAVIARCNVFVGNDSGIAHLAVAVGTPAVVVFGPTDARRYGPPTGRGTAVTPPGGPPVASSLAAARGSRAVETVTVDAVRAALVGWL